MSASSASPVGFVYLVGAGPGDPGLITVRGSRLLERAQVVVYDYLSNPRLLSYCPQDCQRIYVGKSGPNHAMTQDNINALLVKLGLEGKVVVRLKGGDPFVFGRGGEEVEELRKAGVGFEVVPGITSAIGTPCYAGIPVTHRDLNSSFTLITGHEKEEEYKDPQAANRPAAAGSSDIDWTSIAKLPCVAFYMGVKSLPRICAKLIEHGKDPNTPAASIQWGTTPRQRTVVSTVKDLPEAVAQAKLGPPAITIVGHVVKMRDVANWFERRPLFGQTIVVTRTRQQASDLSTKLESLGAEVIEAPTIDLVPAKDAAAVDRALAEAASYDWIVFTSQNGVTHAKQRLLATGRDVRAFGRAKIAVIGRATAEAVERELALKIDLCPQSFVAEALADAMEKAGEVRGKRHLLLRADIARPILRERLQAGGSAQVSDVAIYETAQAANLPEEMLRALDDGRVTWATFTSSSTARNFCALLGENYRARLAKVKLASIGPITTATMRELGMPPTIEATQYDIDGLVDAIVRAAGK